MNDLELIVNEAEQKGLMFLDDIVDHVVLNLLNSNTIKPRSIIKTEVYNILHERDKHKPSLADSIKIMGGSDARMT